MNNLRLYLLAPNLELMGKVISEDDGSVTIEHALMIRPVPNGPDSYGLQMQAVSCTNPEGKTKFRKDAFLGKIEEIPEKLQNLYIQQTSSIEIVSAIDAFSKLG